MNCRAASGGPARGVFENVWFTHHLTEHSANRRRTGRTKWALLRVAKPGVSSSSGLCESSAARLHLSHTHATFAKIAEPCWDTLWFVTAATMQVAGKAMPTESSTSMLSDTALRPRSSRSAEDHLASSVSEPSSPPSTQAELRLSTPWLLWASQCALRPPPWRPSLPRHGRLATRPTSAGLHRLHRSTSFAMLAEPTS